VPEKGFLQILLRLWLTRARRATASLVQGHWTEHETPPPLRRLLSTYEISEQKEQKDSAARVHWARYVVVIDHKMHSRCPRTVLGIATGRTY
jgi:hypothetical protein